MENNTIEYTQEMLFKNKIEVEKILNDPMEIPIDIRERNKKFDLNFNDIKYNKKIAELYTMVSEFKNNYIQKLFALAMGGHEEAMGLAEDDIMFDFLSNELETNELLNTLHKFYCSLVEISDFIEGSLSENKPYLEKQEVEVFMKDWYK
ncbi:hypothetical protein [Mucilaginibacter sp.]